TSPAPKWPRVVGFPPPKLLDPKAPSTRVNRRIDIVVLTKKAQRAIEGDQPPPPAPTQGDGAPGEVPADPNALPPEQEPLPAHELRQKLNLFDDGGVKDPTAPAPGS
ncbi:motility protein MotB, partial [Pseudomonas carnis]|nr:motility protein MotB [Pseudomonas carnis]